MKSITLLILFSISSASANTIVEEHIYFKMRETILSTNKSLTPVSINEKLFVDAFEDLINEYQSIELKNKLLNLQTFDLSLVEKLRIELLKIKFNIVPSMDPLVIEEILNELRKPFIEERLLYILASQEKLLLKANLDGIIQVAKMHEGYSLVGSETEANKDEIKNIVTDLYYNPPDTTSYSEGEYSSSVKLLMLCRKNRLYPCLMIMKDVNGLEVRNSDGSLWSNKALASAVTGFPSHQRNGDTPAGIYTIDSVMPQANQVFSFGKFRRLILNFIPQSEDELIVKSLLPESSWASTWWQASSVARDIGRNLLRIHGSGKLNIDPTTPFFPFIQTHGCIAQRENTYDNVTYIDQQNLLDSMMRAMELEPIFENETKIKGLLYLIDIDDLKEEVTFKDVERLGIK